MFTRTKHGANRLASQLQQDGIKAAAIHSDKTQTDRTQALNDFKQGVVQVLVATDIAARGLDIDQLPHVVNYELPHVPEDYVHRIGRTGRAGASGEALSLVCAEERKMLVEIERLLKRKIHVDEVTGFVLTSQTENRPLANSKQSEHGSKGSTTHHRPREFDSNQNSVSPQTVVPLPTRPQPAPSEPRKKQIAALFLPPSGIPR